MTLNTISSIDDLPEESTMEVKTLVEEIPEVDQEGADALEDSFRAQGYNSARTALVRDLAAHPHLMVGYPRYVDQAMRFSNCTIVDSGMGIGALANAVPREEQEFSTLDVNAALVEAGVLDRGETYLQIGTSGAVLEDGSGAEVIITTLMDVRDDVTVVGSLSKAAWTDEEGEIHVDSLKTDKRVLLENMCVAKRGEVKDSNGIFVDIEMGQDGGNLYEVIAKAAEAAGYEDYTVRATVRGPAELKLAVITTLPEEAPQNMGDVLDILAVHSGLESDGEFHFIGTRSARESRQNERWGEISGDKVYSRNGHYHGFTADGKYGGHVLGVNPKKGAKVMMVIEPANVVQVSEI